MKAKNFIIPLQVYPFDVMVSVGESNEALQKHLARFDVDWPLDSLITKGKCIIFEQNQVLIRFRSRQSADHACIAHECFHAVTMVMDRIGMPFAIDQNDEAYAYLLGFLTEKIYKKL